MTGCACKYILDGLIIEKGSICRFRGQLVKGNAEEQGPENIFQLRKRMLRVQLTFVTGGAPKLHFGVSSCREKKKDITVNQSQPRA